MMQSDKGNCSVLLMLELSSAFDTADHQTSLNRLRFWAGVSGSALHWFSSYLSDRSFSVAASGCKSYVLPQGSVLGPLLFLVYMLPLHHILNTFTVISLLCFDPHEVSKVNVFKLCKMFDDFLHLAEKTNPVRGRIHLVYSSRRN